jgi:hypothetical protein
LHITPSDLRTFAASTWTALDADRKLIVSWLVGGRDAGSAQAFVADLASRLRNRIQLTSAGLKLESCGDWGGQNTFGFFSLITFPAQKISFCFWRGALSGYTPIMGACEQ